MANVKNPKTVTVQWNGKDKDGNPMDFSKVRGVEVDVDGTPFVAYPITAKAADNNYTSNIETAVASLANGTHTLSARIVGVDDTTGLDDSAFTGGNAFDVDVVRTPSAPFGVAVA